MRSLLTLSTYRVLTITWCLAGAACSDALARHAYDVHYEQAVAFCGHPDAAFQNGYNAGYAGDRMRSDWTEMCVAPARTEAVAAYQSGFLQGAHNAPIKVVQTISPGRATSQCTFDSDCGGDGFHCRDHACMGYGAIGDRCVFNEDCSSDNCFGRACRE